MKLQLTDHAIDRARQRLRWSRASLERMVERVFFFGLNADAVHGELHRFLESKQEDRGSMVRAYGEHVFIFKWGAAESGPSLITVYTIPAEFRRHLRRARRSASHGKVFRAKSPFTP